MARQIEHPDLDHLAEIFTAARQESGLSYNELATMTGLSRGTLFGIAAGKVRGNLPTWLILSRAFDVSLDELLAPVWETHRQDGDTNA